MAKQSPHLRGRVSVGCRIKRPRPGARRLTIPAGSSDSYRVAQLDDYGGLARQAFPWRAPVRLQLTARASAEDLPGTWGFGWWNDPFSVHVGIRGTSRRLPTLPNAGWIFHASPENYLALRDDHAAHGLLAAAFSSPRIPASLLLLGAPALPFLLWRLTARLLRRLARRVVRDDASVLDLDPTAWHAYELAWTADAFRIRVDGVEVFATPMSPRGPLGIVIWIDNQAAAFTPEGRVRFGTLANPEAWLDVVDVRIQSGDGRRV